MSLITWTKENSVGVTELDNQHQKMFDLINRLYDSMQALKAKEEISSILQELIDYADYHFSTEKIYFEKFNYPEKDSHLSIHKNYQDKINQFYENQKEDSLTLPYEIIDFLEDWWLHHINGEDKKYTKFFNDNGLV